MRNYSVSWTANNGQEIEVTVISGQNCVAYLGGVEFARGDLTRIGNKGPVFAVIGNKLGMTRENYDRVVNVILQKREADMTDEQRARENEMKDYDNHCRMMNKTMSI